MNISRPVILASASPARARLLAQSGISCIVLPTDVDETCDSRCPAEYAKELSLRKALACRNTHPRSAHHLVIAADTVVSAENTIIGKPVDFEDALRQLQLLSGITHKVITGYTLFFPGDDEPCTGSVESKVTFHALEQREIISYLNTGQWEGAAGSYRIQEHASVFIKEINGSFWNIVGLPFEEIFGIVRSRGYMHVVLNS